MISPKTYYLTEDRENVVEEGDPKAKFLLVREGQEIADADAEKYDLAGVNEKNDGKDGSEDETQSEDETTKGKGRSKK